MTRPDRDASFALDDGVEEFFLPGIWGYFEHFGDEAHRVIDVPG